MTVFRVRSISFEPLVGFTNNFAQMCGHYGLSFQGVHMHISILLFEDIHISSKRLVFNVLFAVYCT